MVANETSSSSVNNKKSKLSLSLRSLSLLNPNANIINRQGNQTLYHNQVTNGSADVETDDNLDDFRSPTKFDVCPKKVKRKDSRPYRYPGDNTCTQDILITAYKKAKEDDTEYRSEDEFVVFQKFKQNKVKTQILNESDSADKKKEEKRCETENSSEHKFLEPVLPSISIKELNRLDKKCVNNKSLRKELKNIKINNVIIEDSEDEIIPCSQNVVRSSFLKTVNNYTAKAEKLASMKKENADSNSLQSSIFSNGNCSIRLLYSEQETDRGTVYFIPKQNCVPTSVLASDKDTKQIFEIQHGKVLKHEVLNKDNTSFDSKKSNNVIQQENDKFSNPKSSMNLHDLPGNNVNSKWVDSTSEQSCAQMSEAQKLEIIEKTSQLGWDEIQKSEEILDLPSQSNKDEFQRISKGLCTSNVDKAIEAKALKHHSRSLTLKKCKLKKPQYRYVRKLWWKSKYFKRKHKHSKVGITRSGVKFRSN